MDDDDHGGGGGARLEVEAVKRRVGQIGMVANRYGGGGGREGIAGGCHLGTGHSLYFLWWFFSARISLQNDHTNWCFRNH